MRPPDKRVMAEARGKARALVTAYLDMVGTDDPAARQESARLGSAILASTFQSRDVLVVAQVLGVSLAVTLQQMAAMSGREADQLWQEMCLRGANYDVSDEGE